jgi:hypothetical protein
LEAKEEFEKNLDLKYMECTEIAIDFNNIYCLFKLPLSKKTVTYRCDNSWKREISLFSMKLVDSFEFGGNLSSDWFAHKLCLQKTCANFCGMFSSFVITEGMLLIGHGMFVSQYNLEKKEWVEKPIVFDDIVRCVFDRSYSSVAVGEIGVLFGPNKFGLLERDKKLKNYKYTQKEGKDLIIKHGMRIIASSFKNDMINNTGLYFFCDNLKTMEKALLLLPDQ